jgi:type I restriction enzyme R subunit
MVERVSLRVVGVLDRPDPRTAGMLPVVVREGERFRFLGSTPMWGEGCDAGEWERLVGELQAVRFGRELEVVREGEPRRLVGGWVGEALRKASEGWGVSLELGEGAREVTRGEWGGKKELDQVVGWVWFDEAREVLRGFEGWCGRALDVARAKWWRGEEEGAREVAVWMMGVLPSDVRARAAAWGTAKDRAKMLSWLGRVGSGVGVRAEELEKELGSAWGERRLVVVGRRSERETQARVCGLFVERLGYRSLGSLRYKAQRGPLLEEALEENLRRRGYAPWAVRGALEVLRRRAEVRGVSLSEANERTYRALRYGVQVQEGAGKPYETVRLVDWEVAGHNDFAVAEEVTIEGKSERRPDLVLYLNGIAVCVLELKGADVSVGEAVRQLGSLQSREGCEEFFSTVQLLIAGNDTEGLRYGTVGTGEKFFSEWKVELGKVEVEGERLDGPLAHLCDKARLLDVLKNFVVFDGGVKKVPRQHQYEAVKAAQARVGQGEGGVIWHTQGSGKSILMVLLAKWIVENDPHARVLVVTDREELDAQIAGVMRSAGVLPKEGPSARVSSRAEFVAKLGATTPKFLCALVHKFDTADFEGEPPPMHGKFYVFVDECHRTQGGLMNRQMKRWLRGAIFIGFTGTPLLNADKKLTSEVFGTYIHTYKFAQAVKDGVVLDLVYEARDVEQRLVSLDEVDKWFEEKTSGLNAHQKALVRKRWGRLSEVATAAGRVERIVEDIAVDFEVEPRLSSARGTALLVAGKIAEACRYYRAFMGTSLAGRCGIVTSYEPSEAKLTTEPEGGEERYKFETYKEHVLREGETTAAYETRVKESFIERPEEMKLLNVVDKLLTGFDAPSCSCIYLDKVIKDHNLFQAICRTNRLDGVEKPYGKIVDYRRLFTDVQHAIAVYNADELDLEGASEAENNVFLKDALREGRERLDEAWERWRYHCEPVAAPQSLEQVLRYFCGDGREEGGLEQREGLRVQFYKASAAFTRAFAAMAGDLERAGYAKDEAARLRDDAARCGAWYNAVKLGAGESLDMKPYEADMRALLDKYIEADKARSLGGLGGLTLLEAIVETGMHEAIARLGAEGKLSKDGVAEVILNNVRKALVREKLTDPKFYAELSQVLEELLAQDRASAEGYEAFLRGVERLVRLLRSKGEESDVPAILEGKQEAQVLFRNLDGLGGEKFVCPSDPDARAALALALHEAVKQAAQPPWRGDQARERKVKQALFLLLGQDKEATEALFMIVSRQEGY